MTLDPEHAAKLAALAAKTYTQEGTLARSLLLNAIDMADLGAGQIVELLDGIPGAYERAQLGRQQGKKGQTVQLDDLLASGRAADAKEHQDEAAPPPY